MGYDVTIEQEQGRHLAVQRFDARPEDLPTRMGAAFGAVMGRLRALGLTATGPAVSCYEMDGEAFHVAAGFVVAGPFEAGDGVEPLQLPEGSWGEGGDHRNNQDDLADNDGLLGIQQVQRTEYASAGYECINKKPDNDRRQGQQGI